ncbi:MAG: metallophosphoesterase family protein [Candidatus Kapaibacterium sp.]
MKLIAWLFMAFLLISVFWGCKESVPTTVSDPVVYSFVVVGCNRVDKKDYDAFTNPSTANIVQLQRTFSEVAALSPKPDFFFFAGDMVLGYADSLSLALELASWKSLYESSPVKAAGIELVALPGNHESEDWQKNATSQAEQIWLKSMDPYIQRGGNGPKANPKGPDSLITDQSKLTYSFNFKDAHFVIISTDPAGRDWRPPSHWIADDVAAAHANPEIKHIFAISHKPGYAWDYDMKDRKNDGLDTFHTNRDIFWNAFEANYVDAMISAHNHVYHAFQPNNKTWMIVAGNGGSKLEKNIDKKAEFYGFTLIQVLKSGTVIEKSYGRNFGSSYIDPSPAAAYPTTLRDSNVISWK